MSNQHYFTHTETETEDQDVAAAVAKQKAALSAVKKKGSDAGRSSFYKRMMVSWFLLSLYVLPLHMGFPYVSMFVFYVHVNIFSEFQVLAMDPKKHRSVSSFVEWLIYFTFVFVYMPRWVLSKTALINSGYTRETHPLVHKILFDWHTTIIICVMIVSLVWFCVGLTRGALRYQFSRLGQAVIAGFISALSTVSLQAFLQLGMFWVVAVPITIAANDTWAYLVGRTFGRTPLISLSPNKTLEGFLGGALFTFVMILIFCQTIFQYKRFTCISQRINPGLFEPVLCTNEDSLKVFQNEEYTVPFNFSASPALLVYLMFGIFTSLAAPFAGFLASGIKRAYQIKDFADTLPGHGGFTDRFDCTLFANIMMIGLLTQILYKEYLNVDKAASLGTELSFGQRQELLAWMQANGMA